MSDFFARKHEIDELARNERMMAEYRFNAATAIDRTRHQAVVDHANALMMESAKELASAIALPKQALSAEVKAINAMRLEKVKELSVARVAARRAVVEASDVARSGGR